MTDALNAARVELERHLAELQDPHDQRASGRIDGLMEAVDFLNYRAAVVAGRIPAHVSFAEWTAPGSGWREVAGRRH